MQQRIVAVCVLAMTAGALGESQSWDFDVTTTGQDVAWSSDTYVDPAAGQYDGQYELTVIELGILWNGIPLGTIDVTSEVPEEFRSGEASVDGPAPIVLVDGSLAYPDPPEEPAIAAAVRVELDEAGYGQVSVRDVALGSITVDLGFPFGHQTVEITSFRVAGTLIIDVVDAAVPNDLNGDGVVDVSDLLAVLASWGGCPVDGPCAADLNGDGTVDVSDMLTVLNYWG